MRTTIALELSQLLSALATAGVLQITHPRMPDEINVALALECIAAYLLTSPMGQLIGLRFSRAFSSFGVRLGFPAVGAILGFVVGSVIYPPPRTGFSAGLPSNQAAYFTLGSISVAAAAALIFDYAVLWRSRPQRMGSPQRLPPIDVTPSDESNAMWLVPLIQPSTAGLAIGGRF